MKVGRERMKLNKWNYETKSYDTIEVPNEWNCLVMSDNMEDILNCPHCGREIKYQDGYTSLEIHTPMGIGYIVCHECYFKGEVKRRLESREM